MIIETEASWPIQSSTSISPKGGMFGLDKTTAVSRHHKQQCVKERASKHGVDGRLEEELSTSNCCLLELAAENDLEGFRRHVEETSCKVDEVGSWYVRLNGSSQMVLEWRTSAMIAALYGSLDVLSFIVKRYALFGGELNKKCGHDGSTALHCAAAGGSEFALEAARILLESGADPTICDALGRQPCQVIDVPIWLGHVKEGLMKVLKLPRSDVADGKVVREFSEDSGKHLPLTSSGGRILSTENGNKVKASALPICSSTVSLSGLSSVSSQSPSQSSNPLNAIGAKPVSDGAEKIRSLSPSSNPLNTIGAKPVSDGAEKVRAPSPSSNPLNAIGPKPVSDGAEKVREYPIDPSLPDIRNGIFTTDDFRMYSFKIQPCSRAYSHDWTECPFVHPGENARRRDPRRYHYGCVPCPEFRKGSCRRGDMCEYAHGVFECWLHPAQYRTRFCKDGNSCNRRVCFFAHTADELRPLCLSTGSGVLSPRPSTFVDISLIGPPLALDMPSILPPYSQSQSTQSGHAASPTSSAFPRSFAGTGPDEFTPSLHLPVASLQSSRSRSSMNARNAFVSGSLVLSDFEGQNLIDYQSFSTQACLNAAFAASPGSGNLSASAGKYRNIGTDLISNNVEGLFASESFRTPPKSSGCDTSGFSQFEVPLQASFSPVSTQKQQSHDQQAGLQTHFGCPTKSSALSLGSSSRSSLLEGLNTEGPGSEDVPMFQVLAAARAAFAERDNSNPSFRNLGANDTTSEWASPTGKLEWGFHSEELFKLKKFSSFGCRTTGGPDPSRGMKSFKEVPPYTHPKSFFCKNGIFNAEKKSTELSGIVSWIDKLSLDQIDS